MEKTCWAKYDSPIGLVLVASDDGGIKAVGLAEREKDFISRLSSPVERPSEFCALFRSFDEYFRGKPVEFKVSLSLKGSEFDLAVWRALQKIKWGSVKSYGEIAGSIGKPGAARAVGGACGRNPVPLIIPCHRVLASGGRPGGFSCGIEIKKKLLEIEGIGYRL
ncbi:MAG: hypothetical protein A2054_09875 [Deltaproteobacteria bacterium GWA2_55_10]|nr:MAG: hypothetical protein A2054_09875 [Deltaproteobacteria bacterium GWA2_55_10]